MKEDKQTTNTSTSLSKQRKLERAKAIKRQQRQKKINKIVSICAIAAIGIGIVSYGGYKIYRNVTKIVASDDYSKYLTDNGFVKDVTATSTVDLCDYSNITIPLSEVEYSDDSVESDIQKQLEQHQTLNKEATDAIKDGDKVNIDYVGTVGGVEFEGGNTNNEGTDLTIGSGTYIDDFEDQLIGHKVGDNVTVDVTFPEDYSQQPSLAGKDAEFKVVVNGIYTTPEFNDAFVKENLSDYATTADDYRTYLKETNKDKNISTWLEKYLADNTTIDSYPKDYLKNLASTMKNDDYSMFESMNAYFANYNSSYAYDSFEDYTGMSDAKYDKQLLKKAKESIKEKLIYQAILEKEGVTVTADDYKAYLLDNGTTEDSYNAQLEQYGAGYMAQQMVKIKALEIVKDKVTVQ